MSEALLKGVIDSLWASFRYDSPEAHAPILIKMISRGIIQDILNDLKEFELKRYSDMIRTLSQLREKLEGKLHE